ncbi:MAG: 4-hydroxy-3-methylbut-2-enyl diphosphate reductase [Clostridia bacterium]|nr:4-hydroxy-3-methylbut-2-enyl diphosphate reductase [Clostridia bacterium]
MIIYKGKHCGFCFGVQRAVDVASSLNGDKNYILGELIHNEQVNKDLTEKGITVLDNVDGVSQLKPGDNLLIRTHGEPESTFLLAKEKGINVIDCTCPFVKDIQNIVKDKYEKGYKIVIIGNSKHPEVIGINGWCNNSALITQDGYELNDILDDKVCIVVQTTFSEEKYNKIIKNFKYSKAKTVDIFKTICYTTKRRQNETNILSSLCDAVIVIGGANSSNTENLANICRNNCKNVFRVAKASEIDIEKIKLFNKVGIVLGASTPMSQFQEVIFKMANNTEEIITTVVDDKQEEVTEKVSAKSEMAAAFDSIKPSKDFKIGQILTAKISSATESGLTISMKNAKKDFELPATEMLGDYSKEDYEGKIGQDIRVMVVGKNPVKFSEKAMEKVLKEEAEIEEIKNGKIFEATIVSTNKGGLTGKFGSYEVFVPASQIKLGFVKDLEKYVGKTLRLKAEKVESRGSRRQIVGSQKVILEAEKAERDAIRAQKEAEFFGAIQEGDVVLGTPVRFVDFGAFIDVNGFDCLARMSDLSWTGCKDCAEVLEIGKQEEFVILKIDQEAKRVSLGYKQLQPKPWDSVAEKYNVGDVVKGKVVRLVKFGAFVEIEKGIDGLVHISQISNQWLENPVSALEVGQEIEAKILDVNPEKERMTLSIKALLPEVEAPAKEENEENTKGKKRAAKEEVEEPELREWKDADEGGISIAEMINKNND